MNHQHIVHRLNQEREFALKMVDRYTPLTAAALVIALAIAEMVLA